MRIFAANHILPLYMDILNNVKHICTARDITLTDVAARLGIHRNTLYISLRADMRISTLQRIADAIGCDVSEFFTGPTATAEGTQQQPGGNVTCPHCGKLLRIRVEADN